MCERTGAGEGVLTALHRLTSPWKDSAVDTLGIDTSSKSLRSRGGSTGFDIGLGGLLISPGPVSLQGRKGVGVRASRRLRSGPRCLGALAARLGSAATALPNAGVRGDLRLSI